MVVKSHNSATYGDKRLMTKIWNAIPKEIKSEISSAKFKEYIDLWVGHKYIRNICKSLHYWMLHKTTTPTLENWKFERQRYIFYYIF